MSVPYWVQDSIFYQIFPDRFANGDIANDPPVVQPWGSKPKIRGFQGGDLRGVINNFDYLLDLGINAIYFNPLFQSPSNHGYHTNDYFRIDPRYGTLKDYQALLDVAHSNNVKVVIDGVFNHSGRGFFAFNDILENQEDSAYLNWYHVNKFPVDAYGPGEASGFKAWWDIKDLPKFNTDEPRVRQYIMDVAKYWIDLGTDGWRLDVPAEIDDDDFWFEFRRVVKSANPDAYIVGEIWTTDPRWVGEKNFDGLMNYPVRAILFSMLKNEISMTVFADQQEELLRIYPKENVYGMYVPLGSHDTRRMLTKLNDDKNLARMAFFYQFSYPGSPAIYYGDEIGMDGGKDPENRKAFPWDLREWDIDLRTFVKNLVTWRKRLPAMRRGDYKRVAVNNDLGYYAFTRGLGDEKVLVVMNASSKLIRILLPVSGLGWEHIHSLKDVLSGTHYSVKDKQIELTLEPWAGLWLTA